MPTEDVRARHAHRLRHAVSGVGGFRDAGALGSMRAGLVSSNLRFACFFTNFLCNQVFRCGHLSKIEPSGRQTIQELGIRHVFDLRHPVSAALHTI